MKAEQGFSVFWLLVIVGLLALIADAAMPWLHVWHKQSRGTVLKTLAKHIESNNRILYLCTSIHGLEHQAYAIVPPGECNNTEVPLDELEHVQSQEVYSVTGKKVALNALREQANEEQGASREKQKIAKKPNKDQPIELAYGFPSSRGLLASLERAGRIDPDDWHIVVDETAVYFSYSDMHDAPDCRVIYQQASAHQSPQVEVRSKGC